METAEFLAHRGLKITLVKDMPSPWCQAAKTIFEVKGLDYVATHWLGAEANPELLAWGGEASSPVVGWQDERPINGWVDILYLAERLEPEPALIPQDVMQRALMFGLSHEICGRMGIGWNRRLELMAPALESAESFPMKEKSILHYGLNRTDAAVASERLAASLGALADQLKAQRAKGSAYFIGDRLTALDIYWTAFSSLFGPLTQAQCPMNPDWRPVFAQLTPPVAAAFDPILWEHRDRIFAQHFRAPMEM
jgi:glutathione S-transferase